MDIEGFDRHLKCVQANGFTVNIEEKMMLKLAFSTLKNNYNIKHLYFWGKITGKLSVTLTHSWNRYLERLLYRYVSRLYQN